MYSGIFTYVGKYTIIYNSVSLSWHIIDQSIQSNLSGAENLAKVQEESE